MFHCTFPIQSMEEVVGTIILCAPRRLWFSCTGTFWGLCWLGRIGIIKRWWSRLTRQLRLPCRPERLWKVLLLTARRQKRRIHNELKDGWRQQTGRKAFFFFLQKRCVPNLLSISCCSSREEKRILGLRPLVWKPSHGGLLVLGLSLGSTSMFKLTWNKSGYFSCMSQASKSYLKGETAGVGKWV